ncbi:MAG: single-stranded DNA-binding protein [Deltaproteobacteria bacterium]|nr:single-stranded DNA-binding protein [Deltaproteobacteria bacterium]
MSDLNQVIVRGRLTRDASLKTLPSGSSVAELSVASNRIWNDRNGNKQEETVFVDVDLWGKQADYFGNNLKKGDYVMVTGRLRRETWETDGQKRSKLSLRADKIDLPPKANGSTARQQEEPEVNFDEPVGSTPF